MMRTLWIAAAVFALISTLVPAGAHADDLEGTIKRNLTPRNFAPESVSPYAVQYVIEGERRLFFDKSQIVENIEEARKSGVSYTLVDFKILERSVHGSIASVAYRAVVLERGKNKTVVTKSITQDIWEHHVNGWVALFGVTQEVLEKKLADP